MPWHTIPRDNAWRQVTLASIHGLGQRLWLRCDHCGHDIIAEPITFSEQHQVSTGTPLLSISLRLVCTCCGERKSHCKPEPYTIERRKQ